MKRGLKIFLSVIGVLIIIGSITLYSFIHWFSQTVAEGVTNTVIAVKELKKNQIEAIALGEEYYSKFFSELALRKQSGDSIINLAEVFDFEWSKLIIPKGYSDIDILKKDYRGINTQIERIKHDDARSLLLFAKDDQIMKYIFLGNSLSDFSSVQKEDFKVYEKGNSLFVIEIQTPKSGQSYTMLRPLN